ncbi:helix-turn-helix transcriptional regulator [Rhodococcus pyridinivorans]
MSDGNAPLIAPAKEVAAFFNMTEAALAQWRYRGTGPKFVRLNRRIFYKWADVYEWIDQNTMQRTDDRPGAA